MRHTTIAKIIVKPIIDRGLRGWVAIEPGRKQHHAISMQDPIRYQLASLCNSTEPFGNARWAIRCREESATCVREDRELVVLAAERWQANGEGK